MFQHKDIKMIVLHTLRRRAPTPERLLLSVYIICILLSSSIYGFLVTAYKAIAAVGRAPVKVRGDKLKWLDLSLCSNTSGPLLCQPLAKRGIVPW